MDLEMMEVPAAQRPKYKTSIQNYRTILDKAEKDLVSRFWFAFWFAFWFVLLCCVPPPRLFEIYRMIRTDREIWCVCVCVCVCVYVCVCVCVRVVYAKIVRTR